MKFEEKDFDLHAAGTNAFKLSKIVFEGINNEANRIGETGLKFFGGAHFTIEDQEKTNEIYEDRLGTTEFYSGTELAEKAKDVFKERKEFYRELLNDDKK